MGVHGTFCQLCGLPTQHDHYVPTASGQLKIYRGSSENGGHSWEAGEHPFPFGPEHAWLKDAVVLPWEDDRVLRGPIEDGAIATPDGDSILVFEGGEDGLAFHHACWELQGSPESTEPAVRANQTHGWALVEPYQEQLFEFHELAADGKAWMLADPRTDAASRGRIEALLAAGRIEVKEAPQTLEEVLEKDQDWSCMAARNDDHSRKSLVRARIYAIQKVPKAGFGALVRITREYDGSALPDAGAMGEVEAFEADLKAAVERGAKAVYAVLGIGLGRVVYLVYARDAAKTKSVVESISGAAEVHVDTAADPKWAEAIKLIESLR